jgi:hypothetical protein
VRVALDAGCHQHGNGPSEPHGCWGPGALHCWWRCFLVQSPLVSLRKWRDFAGEVGRVGWGRPGGRRRVGEQVHGPELRMKTPHMGCMPACIVLEAHHSNHLSPHQHSTNMVARSVLNACDSTNFSHHFCLPFVPSIMLSHTGHIHCLWDSDRQKKMFF